MTHYDRKLLEASLRNDLASFTERAFQIVNPYTPFLPNWHHQAIAHHLELCRHGDINRLIITMPPRNGKSHCTSVSFTAFLLGHNPAARIINATYGQELTADFARQFRILVNSPCYRPIFPTMRVTKDTEVESITSLGGYRFGTSVGGTLTGRGGDFIIIDDPMKPEEAMSKSERDRTIGWFKGTVSTRLDDKRKGVIILVMQRLHEEDLVGHLLETEGARWTQLNLPAIAEDAETISIGPDQVHRRSPGEVLHPEREPREILDEQKVRMGSMVFSAQYQQRPVPTEGNLVKRAWFQTYTVLPERKPSDRIVQSWDMAEKAGQLNDYSVCTTWLVQNNDFYLIDVCRKRLTYPDLKKRLTDLADRYQAGPVLIEDAGHGTPLIQDLRKGGKVRPIAIKPKGDKITRMSAESAKIEAGQVWLPHSAPWLDDFLSEMLAFPNSRYDDQVDSVSQFLGWIMRSQREETVGGCKLYVCDENHPDGGYWIGNGGLVASPEVTPREDSAPDSSTNGKCFVGDRYDW